MAMARKRDRGADPRRHPRREVEITDLAGDGDHYAARVVSASFAGMSRVRQHQAVYAALGGRMGASFTRCSSKPRSRLRRLK
jgi:stress-induced morphogen